MSDKLAKKHAELLAGIPDPDEPTIKEHLELLRDVGQDLVADPGWGIAFARTFQIDAARILIIDHLRKLRTAQKYHTQRLLHLITDKPKSRKAFAEWEQSNHGTLQLIHAEEDKIDELLEELAKLES